MNKYELAGKIVLSKNPGKEMGRIRKELKIKQGKLAKALRIRQSTLSDYERGRRASPGADVIRRWVKAIGKLAAKRL